MYIDLDKLFFETADGTWRSEYIGEPNGLYDSDRVNYDIEFHLVNPNNPESEVIPKRRLRLLTYHCQTAHSDYEEKLRNAIQRWLDSEGEIEATYIYPSITLQLSNN